jgi:hypothetical protein
MVGYVELGTDSWITNITGMILKNPNYGLMLFIWTSGLMFILRFFAGPIVHKISPLGLLFASACLACTGLLLLGNTTAALLIIVAATIYGFGKTFFWPTMLAVVGDRFPRTGAVAMSIMGGLGMMSAGLIGSPGLGYAKDRFAGEALKKADPVAYEQYKAATPSKWLVFEEVHGIDGQKLEKATATESDKRTPEQTAVVDANIEANRQTLRVDSLIPATMAFIYLLMFLYFQAIGGYKALHVGEEITGGLVAPMEG